MNETFYVYILTSKRNGTLYVGVTNNLSKRIEQHHKNTNKESFTARYGIRTLVYYETISGAFAAFTREKQLKQWNRLWKLRLIETVNPDWLELTM